MRDFVTVLECEPGKRLAKRYTDPGEAPGDYDAGWLFKPEQVPVESFSDLVVLTRMLATDPSRCVIRGALKAGALAEWIPRRSKDSEVEADFEPAEHQWVFIDCDASATAFDPADVHGSIATWRASLPEALRSCGMIVQLSAKQHLYPYVRCHAWIWLDEPVPGPALKAWLKANDFDPRLEQCVQVHYTADPVFDGCVDPLEGQRLHVFEGPSAAIDFAPAADAPRTAPSSIGPSVPADASVLEVLGDAREHQGRRWYLCGALGGVWRRQFRSREWAESTIRAWLRTVPGDHQAAVDWCLGAWSVPFPFDGRITGQAELELHLGAEWAERVARASLPEHRRTKPEASTSMAPAVSSLLGDLDSPVLLSGARNMMYVRTEDATGYLGPYHKDQIPIVLDALNLRELHGRGGDGEFLSGYQLYPRGKHIETIVRDFADPRTWYDRDTCDLHHGFVLPAIEPVEDLAVVAWLAALCGDMLPNVLDWIVACQQGYIDQLAAALVMVGPPGIGKTLIFRACARMWGARSFVPLSDSIAQFNGSITRCPIVLDDECAALKARKVTSAEFRQRVQARERDYEMKGKEKVQLLGCTREGITANDLTEVTFTDVRGAGVVDALADRLLVVQCASPNEARQSLAAIRGDGDSEKELARIAGHLSWLWSTRAIENSGRFIGAGGASAEQVALAGVASEGAPIWDSLATFLDGDLKDADPVLNGGRATYEAGSWCVIENTLYGCPSALAGVLQLKERSMTVAKTAAMLRAIASGPPVRFRVTSGGRPRFYPIDIAKALKLV